jgi:hypothetical protein
MERLTHRRGSKAATLLLAGAVLGGSLSACGKDAPIDPNTPGMVLSGKLPYGHVEIYQDGDNCIKGELPYGHVRLCTSSDAITGNSPWGAVNVKSQEGHITGKVPYGKVNVQLTNSDAAGSIPYGNANLHLNQRQVTGKLPYGEATLELGPGYNSLEAPLVVDALVAVFADKT